mgnify:CR=1 FL=1
MYKEKEPNGSDLLLKRKGYLFIHITGAKCSAAVRYSKGESILFNAGEGITDFTAPVGDILYFLPSEITAGISFLPVFTCLDE